MTNNNLQELLLAYETDVRFPDVSGMEHLDMLITRSKLETHKARLGVEEQGRLLAADKKLLHQAAEFYEAIIKVADLSEWRQKQEAPPSHWWWYLDVLMYAWPRLPLAVSSPTTVAG